MTSQDSSRRAITSAVVRALRAERERQELSMTGLAARAGLSQQMVSYVEREMRNPTLDTLLRMSDALGIDISEVLRAAGKRVGRKG